MKKKVVLLLIAVFMSFLWVQFSIAGGIIEKIVAEKKLRVGVAPWKNMIMWDDKAKRYEGIIADDLRNFEEVTGIKVEITNTTWGGMIAGLQTGKWDAIMNGLGASVQRSLAVAFTEAYGYFCEASLCRKGDNIKSFADLDKPGATISLVAGTTGFEHWKAKFKHATIVTYPEATPAVLDVIQGRAKATMGDLLIQTFRAKDRPELLKVFIPENTIFFYEAHAVRYSDLDLLEFLNTYIRNMKLRGWYQELGAKWGMPPEWVTGRLSK